MCRGELSTAEGTEEQPPAAKAVERKTLTCDYMVIGASVYGLGFIDEVMQRDKECTFILADLYGRPGGKLTLLPSFCELGAVSGESWGVSSQPFDNVLGTIDEALLYCANVVSDLVDTGRLRYFPKFEASQDGTRIISVLDANIAYDIRIKRKIVDAISSSAAVRRGPDHGLQLREGANLVSPNDLVSEFTPHPRYVVLGAGPVGISTVNYLLTSGVNPGKISWVVPRAKGFRAKETLEKDRIADALQATQAIFRTFPSVLGFETLMEDAGITARLHERVRPEQVMPRVLPGDIVQTVRKVTDIIRMGYVRAVAPDYLQFDTGRVEFPSGSMFLDCTGSRSAWRGAPETVFTPGRLRVQRLREAGCHDPCHSAAIVALVEVQAATDEAKNRLCTPLCYSETTPEHILTSLPARTNYDLWSQFGLVEELRSMRTNPLGHASDQTWTTSCEHEQMARHVRTIMTKEHPEVVAWCDLLDKGMGMVHAERDNLTLTMATKGAERDNQLEDSLAVGLENVEPKAGSSSFFDFAELDAIA